MVAGERRFFQVPDAAFAPATLEHTESRHAGIRCQEARYLSRGGAGTRYLSLVSARLIELGVTVCNRKAEVR